MAHTTYAQLIAEVRRPGKVEVPLNSEHDTFQVVVEKADLLAILSKGDPGEPAPWYVRATHEDGTRSLDVQTGFDIYG